MSDSGLRKRQRGFAAVPNETVFHAGLSARALGVLVKVIALPEDWDLRMEWLVRQFPEGREAVTTAVRELRRAGFYRVERRRAPGGTFTSGVSVSDVVVPEWRDQHAAACLDQGTEKPKWDVSLKVDADGKLEDQPTTGTGPVADVPANPQVETANGKPVNGGPVNGEPVTGEPSTGEPITGIPAIQDKTHTQTQTQKTPPAPQGPPSDPAPPATPRKRATRLPAGWEPDAGLAAWTRETFPGFPRSELDRFRDHWKATGGTKVDWDATWRNWCREWQVRQARAGARGARTPIAAERRDGSVGDAWTSLGQQREETRP